MPDGALSDLRVLDLGTDVPGPYCAKLFADYGADVIKVEPPEGDPLRRRGPFPGDVPHPEKSALFIYLNSNKRGVTIDRRNEEGRELLRRLIAWADVIIENGAPGDLQRDGFGWEAIAEINPSVVLSSITPFGQTGPYRDYAADEITLFAMSGRMWSHGLADREPLRYGPDMAWFQAGQTAAVASLAALFAARRFGIGQHVDVSALEALAGNVDARSIFHSMTGVAVQRPSPSVITSLAGAVPCSDGYLLMIAAGERFFRRLMRAVGCPELADDKRFATPAARQEHAGELDAIILPWLAERTRREAFEQLQAFRVMCAPVQTAAEVLSDPQLAARGYFQQLEHPMAGTLSLPGAPFAMQRTPFSLRRPAPLLGEHNHEVFASLPPLRAASGLAAEGARR